MPSSKLLASLSAAFTVAVLLTQTALAASSDKTFAIANTGNGPMTVATTAQPISGNTSEFALADNTCGTLQPGDSCSITVRFTPEGEGSRPPASLNFTSNGNNGPTHSINLSGTGQAPNHRYWRVVYTGITPNAYNPAQATQHGALELEFRASLGGADLTGTGTAIASSYSSVYTPDKAFDNTLGVNLWYAATGAIGEWIGYQFSTPVMVRQLYYYPYNFGAFTSFPTANAIEYSDNGTAWTRVKEFTGLSWSAGTPKTFDF